MQIDEQKVEAFVGRIMGEMAATGGIASIHLGDRLGLYRSLLAGPATADQLARRTGCNPRLVAEWLAGQAAAGYLVEEPGDERYVLPAEHAAVLAVDESAVNLTPGAAVLAAEIRNQDRVEAAFRGEQDLPWGDQHESLFSAVDRFYGTTYRAALVDAWIPALDGVAEKLTGGGRVLDVGCGFGTATVLLAKAFPAARVEGVDPHQPSLDVAAGRATEAGLADRLVFRAGTATTYGDGPYDLICFFDSLHDMGDPGAALAHARGQLATGGTVMAVEPMATETPAEAVGDLVSRLYYAGSATLCTPHAVSEGGLALGNQVPESTWRKVFAEAGFGSFRRATETPFNRVFEARIS